MEYIKINDIQIPIKVKNYANSKSIKMFFKESILIITKPTYISQRKLIKIIDSNKQTIYKTYLDLNNTNTRKWETGETILYFGKELKLNIFNIEQNKIKIYSNEDEILIGVSTTLNENEKLEMIKDVFKQYLKKSLLNIIYEKTKYWANIIGVSYTNISVKYMTTRWGSCAAKTKRLNFNCKLAMLPQNVIDSVIVHELCHIKVANHSNEFWELVYKYFSDYDKCNKYIKANIDKLNI